MVTNKKTFRDGAETKLPGDTMRRSRLSAIIYYRPVTRTSCACHPYPTSLRPCFHVYFSPESFCKRLAWINSLRHPGLLKRNSPLGWQLVFRQRAFTLRGSKVKTAFALSHLNTIIIAYFL